MFNADHIQDFLEWNHEFVVFLDCDTDGLCSAAICNLYFSELDNVVHYKMASRSQRGFQKEDVDSILREYPSATGILTVDCGIRSTEAVDYANDNGLDVCITDHHNPDDVIPKAMVFNPKLDKKTKHFDEFCGAGVIYLLLRENFGEIPGALQYAAIATVADMVPLISDNRWIVQNGIKELRNPTKRIQKIDAFFSGIKALVLNEKDIGWSVAPVINSASRLGKEQVAFDAFVLADSEAITELYQLNIERKNIVEDLYEQGKDFTTASVNGISMSITKDGNEYTGVLGLLAMKLLSDYGLPAITGSLGDDRMYHYSMRAPQTTDFISSLGKLVEEGGGHDEAGGFSSYHNPDEIFDEFHRYYKDVYENLELLENKQSVGYDIEIDFRDAINVIKDLDKLRPFGVGFDEPTFVSRNVIVEDDGETKSGKYKRYKVFSDDLEEVGYVIDFGNVVKDVGEFDIAYKISYNVFLKGPQIDIIEMSKI